jgi:ribosome biogenesis protein Nip4
MLTVLCWGEIVVKAHVGRWSEDCPEHQGCVVYSMSDVPLGFGVVRFTFFVLNLSRDTADV